jgi:membrane associated rhomboid family serine protease
MFGAGADLRCSKCASKRRSVYAPKGTPTLKLDGTLTKLLIAVAVAFFLFDSVPQNPPQLPNAVPVVRPLEALDAQPTAIWRGELWRLFTSTLLHGGFLHIAFNLYVLWQLGPTLEAWMGKIYYLIFLAALGVVTVASELIVSMAAAIGLSGIVYGMFGLLYALRRHKDFAAQVMNPQMIQILVIGFFLSILMTASRTLPIANIAHAVGAGIGWLLGEAYLHRARRILIPLVIVGSFLIGASTYYMPWHADYCYWRVAQGQTIDERTAWREQAQRAVVGPILFAPAVAEFE